MKYTESAWRGFVSYPSPSIQNEFISVLSNHAKQKLIAEIKDVKRYFGMSFGSTPFVLHVDQMSEVIRYVSTKEKG